MDEAEAKKKGPWGGIYVGPASEMVSTESGAPGKTAAGQTAPVRVPSQKKKKEEADGSSKDAPLWGGVYVGPASNVSLYSLSSYALADGHPPKRRLKLFGRSRSHSESSSSAAGRSKSASGKPRCENCKKKCSGDILKVEEKYFHIDCFVCKACSAQLNEVGYFEKDHNFYCPKDFHTLFGQRCPACKEWVEGEIVQVLGETYHQKCFKCDRCKQQFPAGQKVTFTGKEHLCEKCVKVTVAGKVIQQNPVDSSHLDTSHPMPSSPTACAACNDIIHSGQVLLALDTQWHIWCFKCETCESVLHGEYMAKDGKPYCIRDYNAQFGVRCDECSKFIAGRVLQAGDYHFHPSCARCFRCGDHFGDGEEMYMQGDEIWHPRCNDLKSSDAIPHLEHTPPKAPKSPKHGAAPKSPRSSYSAPKYSGDFGKCLTYMYLLPEPNLGYLKQPVSPHPADTPQFHTPSGKPVKIRKSRISMLKTGMQKLAQMLDDQSPRVKSPYMDNEEPIEMAHYPAGHMPDENATAPIDREDFPAPAYPYAVDELRRRFSQSDKEDEEEERVDGVAEAKLLNAEKELKKYEKESSIAHVVIKNLEEQAKKIKNPPTVDPRSASRTASAKKIPMHRCRYESPINASPSRFLSRPRPWEKWDQNKRSATTTIPYYQVPKPGYGLAPKASTLPAGGMHLNGFYDITFDDLDTTRSSDYSELNSTFDGRQSAMSYKTDQRWDRFQPSYGGGMLRCSLPDMSKPPTIYPFDQLSTKNKKLPEDVDRCHLERHLAKEEFERIFKMTPLEFYKLPDWKRINLKRRAKLF